MLQMFISHINRIKSKLPIKNEKDKSSLILRDRQNVKNFVRFFVLFFSILFPILFRIFERTLIFQFETRTSRICGFNNTVGYAVFVSLKVRKFEFFLQSEVVQNLETLESLHITSAYILKKFILQGI